MLILLRIKLIRVTHLLYGAEIEDNFHIFKQCHFLRALALLQNRVVDWTTEMSMILNIGFSSMLNLKEEAFQSHLTLMWLLCS